MAYVIMTEHVQKSGAEGRVCLFGSLGNSPPFGAVGLHLVAHAR